MILASEKTYMDSELAKLETRLAKTRDMKAGLMQELLTGRIRLASEEASRGGAEGAENRNGN